MGIACLPLTMSNFLPLEERERGELSSFADQLRYAWELDSWAQSYVDLLVFHILYTCVRINGSNFQKQIKAPAFRTTAAKVASFFSSPFPLTIDQEKTN